MLQLANRTSMARNRLLFVQDRKSSARRRGRLAITAELSTLGTASFMKEYWLKLSRMLKEENLLMSGLSAMATSNQLA